MSGVINGNQNCCGTCEYWSGPRRLNSISEVKYESSAGAKCTRHNSHYSAHANCGEYKKWSNLR
jgi:hypothetical protein